MILWSMRKRRQQEDGLGVIHTKGYFVEVINRGEIAEDYYFKKTYPSPEKQKYSQRPTPEKRLKQPKSCPLVEKILRVMKKSSRR